MSSASKASSGVKGRVRHLSGIVFSDDMMAVLAFLIIPVVGLPMVFGFSKNMLMFLDLVNYFIIAMFIAEYVVMLYLSNSRVKFITDPWHFLDLIIILLALLSLAPVAWLDFARASPVLRLLRPLRILTAAGRVAKGKEHVSAPIIVAPQFSRMVLKIYDKSGIKSCVSNGSTCEIPQAGGPAWLDIEDASIIDLDAISAAIHVPRFVLESKISQEAFPRIDYFNDYTTIFVWDARLAGDGFREVNVARNGLLIVCSDNRLVTICTGKSILFDSLVAEGMDVGAPDFAIQALYGIFKRKVHDGEEIVRALERKTAQLEELPVGNTPSSFLEDTFHLRKDVLMVSKNLWHLRQVLDNLRARKIHLSGIRDEHLHMFDMLYDETDYLYETSDNIVDSLQSLRELHINTVSYEMTRVMRILAVITCLALVPSTIGGLLGENILGVPFQINLGEVALIVISLMILELYAFYKMGWLR